MNKFKWTSNICSFANYYYYNNYLHNEISDYSLTECREITINTCVKKERDDNIFCFIDNVLVLCDVC